MYCYIHILQLRLTEDAHVHNGEVVAEPKEGTAMLTHQPCMTHSALWYLYILNTMCWPGLYMHMHMECCTCE